MLLLSLAQAVAAPGYLRTPDIDHGTVVFEAEGDLWTAPVAGGNATRITANVGEERLPRFSPDGQWVAFTGELDGNGDVYVVARGGGEPRRLTWNPEDDQVIGWSADGSNVYFRSRRAEPHERNEVWAVPAAGGDAAKLPIGWAAWVDEEPGTGRLAFTRTGRESATWKRYRGGSADDIWGGSPAKADFSRLTTFAGIDAFPMWFGGKIYFLTDEGGTGNLWRMDADGKNRTQLTTHTDWDARWPAMGPDGSIVYMLGGDIWRFDPTSGKDEKLAIDVPLELDRLRARYPWPEQYLEYWDLSPDGDRVLATIRGNVYSIPVKSGGVTLPVRLDSRTRESGATFSSDGKRVLYVTDEGGEQSIVSADAWGRGDVKTVRARGDSGWLFPPVAAPGGNWIAWSDQTQTLWVAAAGGGAPKKVDHSDQSEIRDYRWSADGRWLAWSRLDRREFTTIYLYDTKDGSTHAITTGTTYDYAPTFDPQGRYLYFLGDRSIDPMLGERDFNYIVNGSALVYAVLLRPDVDDPTRPRDGLPPAEDPAKEKGKDKGRKDKKDKKDDDEQGKDGGDDDAPTPVEIDFVGLADRIVQLPIPAGEYNDLGATADSVFIQSFVPHGLAWEGGPADGGLQFWSIEGRELKPFADGLNGFTISRKGDKIALAKDAGVLAVVDAGSPPDPDAIAKGSVSWADIVLDVNVRDEWTQMYFEAWRLMRDFVWEPNMGGVDWKGVRDHYATLMPRLATRSDFNDVLGEVIGELNTSHTYVGGGDMGQGPEGGPGPGLLGADVVRDGAGWRITHIFRGDPADNEVSPLLAPGAAVAEGEVVLAVNHKAAAPAVPLEAMLSGVGGKRVVLTVSAKPDGKNPRDVVVTPVSNDHRLRYVDWVRKNREYVAEKTGGKIGYIHIPDMGAAGLVAFDTWFYPQLDREGMVIDCRWNRGGFVSQLILERLRRRVIGFDRARGGGINTYPARTLNGPFVVLTNEFAGSDGDIFPESVQQLGIAPVIGERSWGGVIGIRGDKPLVDGGFLTQPEYAYWWPKGGWIVENHGVDPDIEVQNTPADVAAGRDPQLDRAISEVLKAHDANPPVKPAFGPEPRKARKDYQEREGH